MVAVYRPQRTDDPYAWQPRRVTRVLEVITTSTLPIKVMTDDGPALLKYMGNRQGIDALTSELIAARLAVLADVFTPQFCLIRSPPINAIGVGAVEGPAFASRWVGNAVTAGPNSPIIQKLRRSSSICSLMIFDTWIKNFDRGAPIGHQRASNFDNILFVPDKRMVEMLAIDHTHAFVESSFDDELKAGWCEDETPYGIYESFRGRIQRRDLESQLSRLASLSEDAILDAINVVPAEWQFTMRQRQLLAIELRHRAHLMRRWMPGCVLDQGELDLGANS